MPKKGPVDAVVALTYGCNLRCVTCDLSDRTGEDRLTPADLRRLPDSLRYLNLSGGEPFLLDDVGACVRAAAEATGAEITISTNGTLPERAESAVRETLPRVPGLRVAVSLDGLETTHDRIRQAAGSFAKALQTIDRLIPLLKSNCHVAFTISAANYREFGGVAALARERGLPLSLAFAHTSEHYFRPREDVTPTQAGADAVLREATRHYLSSVNPKAAARAYFAWGLRHTVATGHRPIPCRAGDRFFYLGPTGDLYLCNMRGEALGNLKQSTFDEIWTGAGRASLLPTTGDACPIQCWMVCTARTAIRDHPVKVAAWAARAYLNKRAYA